MSYLLIHRCNYEHVLYIFCEFKVCFEFETRAYLQNLNDYTWLCGTNHEILIYWLRPRSINVCLCASLSHANLALPHANWGYHKIKSMSMCFYLAPKNKIINHALSLSPTNGYDQYCFSPYTDHPVSYRILISQQTAQTFRQDWVNMRTWHLVLMGNVSYCDFRKPLCVCVSTTIKILSHAQMVS